LYGSGSGAYWLIEDNNGNISVQPEAGQILEIRDARITSDALYFLGRKAVNNTRFLKKNEKEALAVRLKEVKPEVYGGDGYAVVEVTGGKPDYSYLWESFTGSGWTFKGVTQNLINASANEYRLTVQDTKGVTVQIQVSIATSQDGDFLATSGGDFITTTGGDKIRVRI